MTSTLRARLARSRQAKAGSKRVEVVLDAGSIRDLKTLQRHWGLSSRSETIGRCIVVGMMTESVPETKANR